MRENRARTLWKAGGAAINGWLGIPSSIAAENMAQAGWDTLTIDMQHGLVDYATALTMLQAISIKDITPFVRVSWNEPDLVQRMLDAGTYGVICPMINSREECERFVASCRYAPRGIRSLGPARAVWYGGADYVQHANDTVVSMAMIETKEALADLDDILSTPELDAIYVGPGDLSLSMTGRPGMDVQTAPVLQAIEHIARRCRDKGIVAGIHCVAPDYAAQMVRAGYQFVSIASDNALLSRIAQDTLTAVREHVAAGGAPAPAAAPGVAKSPY